MIKVYHVTSSKYLDSIFKDGLLKDKFDDLVVWVFKNYDRAVSFMSWNFRELDTIIILNVNERILKRGSCYDMIKEYYTVNDIKANRIIGAYIIDGHVIYKENDKND